MDFRRERDSGFTLVEVLVAMIVLGIGVTALLTAFATHAKTSAANRDQAQAESILTAATEYVKSLAYPSSCSGVSAGTVPPAALSSSANSDTAFAATYGPGAAFDGASLCTIQQVPVHV